MSTLKKARPDTASKLRGFLRSLEQAANRIRKLLRDHKSRSRASRSRSIDNAVKLAELVERLAHHGQSLAAADAIDLADRLELLLEMLRAELDAILVS